MAHFVEIAAKVEALEHLLGTISTKCSAFSDVLDVESAYTQDIRDAWTLVNYFNGRLPVNEEDEQALRRLLVAAPGQTLFQTLDQWLDAMLERADAYDAACNLLVVREEHKKRSAKLQHTIEKLRNIIYMANSRARFDAVATQTVADAERIKWITEHDAFAAETAADAAHDIVIASFKDGEAKAIAAAARNTNDPRLSLLAAEAALEAERATAIAERKSTLAEIVRQDAVSELKTIAARNAPRMASNNRVFHQEAVERLVTAAAAEAEAENAVAAAAVAQEIALAETEEAIAAEEDAIAEEAEAIAAEEAAYVEEAEAIAAEEAAVAEEAEVIAAEEAAVAEEAEAIAAEEIAVAEEAEAIAAREVAIAEQLEAIAAEQEAVAALAEANDAVVAQDAAIAEAAAAAGIDLDTLRASASPYASPSASPYASAAASPYASAAASPYASAAASPYASAYAVASPYASGNAAAEADNRYGEEDHDGETEIPSDVEAEILQLAAENPEVAAAAVAAAIADARAEGQANVLASDRANAIIDAIASAGGNGRALSRQLRLL